ncbi:hypothetical protein TNIN_435311 [Trichonephila inaurata madagascariensis]|uniref:Uncharacterized protein n=1 Tax=Trichonephila inaurata madagascariensis TaxID=2747483 RepID=A0A8X6Y964_9ARAC|nr:hypothetical protein TNIN_435311 [Trichonephila inaurata madagascariensis]
MDVENAPSEKRENSEVRSRVALVSWRTRKAGNDILPRPRGGGTAFYRRGTTRIRHQRAKSGSALQPSVASRGMWKSGNDSLPIGRGGGRSPQNFRRSTTFSGYFRASVPTNKIVEWNYDSTSGFEWT